MNEKKKIRRLPVENRNWYNEREAAKVVGVKNNIEFYKCFVETGHIAPIVIPFRKQRKYLKHEVEQLLEKIKAPIVQIEVPEKETIREIALRLLKKHHQRRTY